MSWISWMTSLVPTLLVVLASLAWWHTEPKTALVNLIAFGGVLFFCFTVAPGLTRDLSLSAYTSYANTVNVLSLDSFVVRHANMLLTGAAVVWYVLTTATRSSTPSLPQSDAMYAFGLEW
jgi:hypothetical protein